VPLLPDDWFTTLLDDELDLTLPRALIRRGDGLTFSGTGTVLWKSARGTRFRAVTDGAERLFDDFARRSPARGLVPLDEYIHIEGATQDGWNVRTDSVPADDYSLQGGSGPVLWDVSTRGVTLTLRAEGVPFRLLEHAPVRTSDSQITCGKASDRAQKVH
jgi:hypothetical protein